MSSTRFWSIPTAFPLLADCIVISNSSIVISGAYFKPLIPFIFAFCGLFGSARTFFENLILASFKNLRNRYRARSLFFRKSVFGKEGTNFSLRFKTSGVRIRDVYIQNDLNHPVELITYVGRNCPCVRYRLLDRFCRMI
jgi:hypothetical protein